MIRNRGKFIVFEGLDGSGQSTQAELLNKFLRKKGYITVLTKEPTRDSIAGKKIRKILDKKEKTSPKKLQLLFAKDRKEHLRKTIIPALKKGKTVFSDRYFFSSLAFGAASGLNLNWLIKINKEFLTPDITFILNTRPEICLERIEKRAKRKTLFEKKEKLKKAWKTYLSLPKKFKKVYLVDGEKPIKEVFGEVKKILKIVR